MIRVNTFVIRQIPMGTAFLLLWNMDYINRSHACIWYIFTYHESYQSYIYLQVVCFLCDSNKFVSIHSSVQSCVVVEFEPQWWCNSFRPSTHICVSKLTIIGSDNGLLPGRGQAIIWTNTGILLIGPLGTNFSEILIEIQTFSFKKMYLKMSSGKWWPFCLGLNVLTLYLMHCMIFSIYIPQRRVSSHVWNHWSYVFGPCCVCHFVVPPMAAMLTPGWPLLLHIQYTVLGHHWAE